MLFINRWKDSSIHTPFVCCLAHYILLYFHVAEPLRGGWEGEWDDLYMHDACDLWPFMYFFFAASAVYRYLYYSLLTTHTHTQPIRYVKCSCDVTHFTLTDFWLTWIFCSSLLKAAFVWNNKLSIRNWSFHGLFHALIQSKQQAWWLSFGRQREDVWLSWRCNYTAPLCFNRVMAIQLFIFAKSLNMCFQYVYCVYTHTMCR